MSWLGLDIGGANLKAADGHGWACSTPFALWREPEKLAVELAGLLRSAPDASRLAVTMTGELCDCYRSKAEGVRSILAALREEALGREVCVFLTDGRFVPLDEAGKCPQLTAASNWRALAEFACRYMEAQPGLLIDIGSTTTDVVPLVKGRPQPRGLNDTERLLAGELVYTGISRTPICAVTRSLPWRGRQCAVAAEFFATTADAYVLLGDLPEQRQASCTADGRPLTLEYARERLARMICADADLFSIDDARRGAEFIRDTQIIQLQAALDQVMTAMTVSITCVVLSGAGEFLARRVVTDALPGCRIISLAERLGADVSKCAPAHALAVLATEELGL
jgi:(4-(4-[2-(gamma-L-glutamylamino)ethyl]phenoxymethyl)furan-2-yl)methanamine synthase